PKSNKVTLLRHHLNTGPGGTSHLTATTRTQFDVVDRCAERNLSERHRVPDPDLRTRPGNHWLADFETHRMENITALPVLELDQRDIGAAVRIILDPEYASRRTDTVPTKIHNPVLSLMPSAAAPHCDVAVMVTPTLLRKCL